MPKKTDAPTVKDLLDLPVIKSPKKVLAQPSSPRKPTSPKKSDDGERSFTIVSSSTGKVGGRYTGLNPDVAARKAARQLFGKIKRESLEKFDKMALDEDRHSFVLAETFASSNGHRRTPNREYTVTLGKDGKDYIYVTKYVGIAKKR
jgi:hypothetical protein